MLNEDIKKSMQKLPKNLLNLLCYMAFLDPESAIEKQWLIELKGSVEQELVSLQKQSLITFLPDQEALTVHSDVLKILTDEKLISETSRTNILYILANYFNSMRLRVGSRNANDSKMLRVVPHVFSILDHIKTDSIKETWTGPVGDLVSIINLLIVTAQFYRHKSDGYLDKAEKILDETQRLCKFFPALNNEADNNEIINQVETAITYERGVIYLYKTKIDKKKNNEVDSKTAKTLLLTAVNSMKAHEFVALDIAQCCQEVAYLMFTIGEYSDASMYSDNALEYFEKANDNNDSKQVNPLLIAEAHRTRGNLDAIIPNFKQAKKHLIMAEKLYMQSAEQDQDKLALACTKKELASIKEEKINLLRKEADKLRMEAKELEDVYSAKNSPADQTTKNTSKNPAASLLKTFFNSQGVNSQPATDKQKPTPPPVPPKDNRKDIQQKSVAVKSTQLLPKQQPK